MAKIVIFSGAGISAESGISTFRDSDGLWKEYSIKDVCTAGCLETNRKETIEFYNKRRIDLNDKKPNKAHKIIAELKNKYPNDIDVITQNVDDLFEKAGCNEVMHLHGFLTRIRCMRNTCGYKEDIAYTIMETNQKCPICNKTMRPDVVFFYEPAPMYKVLDKSLLECKMLVVIGTSGYVIDTSILLRENMEKTILNNLQPSDAIDDKLFSKVIYQPATKAIDEIKNDIEDYLNKQT